MDYARRHLRFGWWALLVFAALGLLLESLQGFKVAAYLDVSNETRRLMWRLAHAHGGLLAAINILFALTLRSSPPSAFPGVQRMSAGLIAATILLPAGFFLGGVVFYSGDPGGAVLLLLALFWIARAIPGE